MADTLDVALSYRSAGLCVLPASVREKRPTVKSWKKYESELPSDDDLLAWFSNDIALCIVTGKVSGNLEMIDFDCAGERFAWWKQLVQMRAPGLFERLVIERSQSGGYHAVYRCQSEPCGNITLAERTVSTPNDQPVTLYGRQYRPREVGGRWQVCLTLIETRGEGGLFLCAPSPGYELIQGRFEQLPELTDEQRDLLLEIAWSLNEREPQPEPMPVASADFGPAGERPGDDFNARGDVRSVLRKHGWTLVRPGANEYWRRPGKNEGWSATLKDGVFWVHTTTSAPFEPRTPYSPFSIYAVLEHNNDFSAAASALRSQGYGREPSVPTDVDLSQFAPGSTKPTTPTPPATQPPAKPPPYEFEFISSRQLANTEFDMEYLIEGILVRNQPMIVAAPRKGLKTNTCVDMALALAEGGLYLGRFNVPKPVRVGMMSAESGEATIQETARRITQARCKQLADFENPYWAFKVPQLDCRAHLDALQRAIEKHKLEVLILDPTYLMMVGIGDGASNLFLVGSFLQPLGDLARQAGVTVILCHHLKKGVVDPYEPAELDSIAWAGFQEYVRQWILLNRRVRYDPAHGGHHELWMSVGGSAGHSGLWGLNIDEGTRDEPGGRRWEVEVVSAEDAYALREQMQSASKEKRKQREEQQRVETGREALLAALARFPDGETPKTLRETAHIGTATLQSLLAQLIEEDIVEECTIQKHTRREPAYRLVDSTLAPTAQKHAGLPDHAGRATSSGMPERMPERGPPCRSGTRC